MQRAKKSGPRARHDKFKKKKPAAYAAGAQPRPRLAQNASQAFCPRRRGRSLPAFPRSGGPAKGFFYFKKKKPAAPYFPPYRSIIGAGVLDFRVRNGNGYIHPTMATGIQMPEKIKEDGTSGMKDSALTAGTRIWSGLTTY